MVVASLYLNVAGEEGKSAIYCEVTLETDELSCFLIGNSLSWETVPSKLGWDTQWHVDCGKSLPLIFENSRKP
jgi:hypothetical protein